MQFRYQDKKTIVHRLHPLCKVLWVCSVFVGSLILDDPILLLLLFLSTIPFFILGRIVHEWLIFMRFALLFSLFIFLINCFASQHGSTIIYHSPWPSFSFMVSLESIVFGVMMCMRLFATLSAFAFFSLTVDPDRLMNTLLLLRFPQKSLSTASLSFRFMPLLFQDLEILQQSLQTRGYALPGPKGFFQRMKRQMILVIPLLSNSLDRAIQSAEAMEARGFGSSGKKTLFKKYNITTVDSFLIGLTCAGIVFFLLIFVFDFSSFSIYPTVSFIRFSVSYLLLAAAIVFVVLLPLLFSPLKKVIDLDSI